MKNTQYQAFKITPGPDGALTFEAGNRELKWIVPTYLGSTGYFFVSHSHEKPNSL